MKHSRFTIFLPVPGMDGHHALYQTMTGGMVILAGKSGPEALDSVLASGDVASLKLLREQGFLVPEEVDETRMFHLWFQQHVHLQKAIHSVTMVTRKCNLRCRYCVVAPEARDMTPETALAVDGFYFDVIRERRPLKIRDGFHGGEPLMNLPVILESASRRFAFCKEREIDYSFTFVTNGTLLTPESIRSLAAVGLSGIRVSMAGPEEIHDGLRITAGGGKTFSTIVANLKAVSGLTPISIECQYDAATEDYKTLPGLMDYLIGEEIPLAGIAFTPILPRRANNIFAGVMGDPQIPVFLKQEAAKRGIPVYDEAPSNACMADFRSHFVFDTDGSIIPCPSLQGGEMAYGNATDGVDFALEADLRHREFPEKCLEECDLLPVCLGGCRHQALTRGGSFAGVDCHYDMWRAVVEDHVRARVSVR